MELSASGEQLETRAHTLIIAKIIMITTTSIMIPLQSISVNNVLIDLFVFHVRLNQ